jgi:hypothetical protein
MTKDAAQHRSWTFYEVVNLGEAEDQQCQLVEPGGRVLTSSGASLRLVKKRFRTSEKGFGQQPVDAVTGENKKPPALLGLF